MGGGCWGGHLGSPKHTHLPEASRVLGTIQAPSHGAPRPPCDLERGDLCLHSIFNRSFFAPSFIKKLLKVLNIHQRPRVPATIFS